MSEVEVRLIELLLQVLPHPVVALATIETDCTLPIRKLCCIDKCDDTGTTDVLLVGFASLGQLRQDVGRERLSGKALQLLLESQLARFQTSVACLLAPTLTESLRPEVNMVVDAVQKTATHAADSYFIH